MLFGNNRFTTVDIGSYSIKVLEVVKKKEGIYLLKKESQKLPADTIKEDKINFSVLSTFIQSLFERLDYKPKKIVTSVFNKNLLVRNIVLPFMKNKELEEAIKWEAEKYIPFSLEQARLDYIVAEQSEDKLKILLFAVKRDDVENIKNIFCDLSVKSIVVNVQPVALLSLLNAQRSNQKPSVILDIGFRTTKLVICDNKNIYLFRTFDVGAKVLFGSLSDNSYINIERIENLISKDKLKGQIFINTFENIIQEILKSIEFINLNQGIMVEEVYITGGIAGLNGFKEKLQTEIDQNIYFLNPFPKFKSKNIKLEDKNVNFSVTSGLAISEVAAGES